jgi:glycerol-3-phosphate acyltransferase PlsY
VRGLALLALGYLCGSIPAGLLLARRAGVDVRRSGSGNIGAANVARTAGAGLGLATLVCDALKGALPVLLARAAGSGTGLEAAVGGAAFLGHVFPVTLRFAGGKGVATALGVLLVLHPLGVAAAAAVFVLLLAAARYVSVASIAAALTAPVAIAVAGGPRPVVGAAAGMAAVIVARHRDNLRRLAAGTEPRFGLHKRQAAHRK